MKITLAQINPVVGDFSGIKKKIEDIIKGEKSRGADLIIFPELSLTGYPPMDLLLKKDFIKKANEVFYEIVYQAEGIGLIMGLPTENPNPRGKALFNSLAFIHDRKIIVIGHKSYLPNYDVFDEVRYFEPGKNATVVNFRGVSLGLTICEDIWNEDNTISRKLYTGDLLEKFRAKKIQVLVNISASPYHRGKTAERSALLHGIAKKYGWYVLYVNQVGAQDSLVFDGGSSVWSATGENLGQAPFFKEALLYFNLPTSLAEGVIRPKQALSATEQIKSQVAGIDLPGIIQEQANMDFVNRMTIDALILGIKDYVAKTNMSQVILGLSGGIDSAFTAYLAAMALGSQNVLALLMPSDFSSQGSVDDARVFAELNGISYKIISISALYQEYLKSLSELIQPEMLEPTHENIQARIRGNLLMAHANKNRAMVLATSNKSESAVGYSTLYGDMCGGLAPVADVPKTLLYELCGFVNRQSPDKPPIPQSIIDKEPSAELRPDQKDSDSLPPYEILDAIIFDYVDNLQPREEIVTRISRDFTMDEQSANELVQGVIKKINYAEYKRKQAAIALKISRRDFSIGRRFPIVQKYEE